VIFSADGPIFAGPATADLYFDVGQNVEAECMTPQGRKMDDT
jgi:hypothetical protein